MARARASRWFSVLALLAACFAGREARAARFTVTNLGVGLPFAINNAGQVAGKWGSCVIQDATHFLEGHAVLWNGGVPSFISEDIGVTSACSAALDVNAAGQVVGYRVQNPPPFGPHAVLWSGGVATELGTLGGSFSYARAINDAGEVVGWAETATEVPDPRPFSGGTRHPWHAFLWREGVMTDLGTLDGPDSRATAINNRSQVLGLAGDFFPARLAPLQWFLWQNSVMTAVDGGGDAINDAGRVLSQTGTICGTEWISLEPLAREIERVLGFPTTKGELNVFAQDLNNRGQVVGYLLSIYSSIDPQHPFYVPFVYTNGELIDLRTAVDPPVFLGAGYGINDNGQMVAQVSLEQGTNPGYAVVLTPTEPLPPLEVGSCPPPKYVRPGGTPTTCATLGGLDAARCLLDSNRSPPDCANAHLPRALKSRLASLRTVLARAASTSKARTRRARLRAALGVLKQARKAALRAGRPPRQSISAACASALDTLFGQVRTKVQDALL